MAKKYENRGSEYNFDNKQHWQEFINDIDNFIGQATDDKDYAERLKRTMVWINTELKEGYDEGSEAKKAVLEALLKKKFAENK